MRKIGLALAALVVLTGCGEQAEPAAPVAAPSPTTLIASGTITVPSSEFSQGNADDEYLKDVCSTDGGYQDISYGAQVKVADASGTTLAVGSLGGGTFDNEYRTRCSFAFTIPDVPAGKALYAVSVGNVSRGSITYKAEDLSSLQLSLG